jgi:hypothetical protein
MTKRAWFDLEPSAVGRLSSLSSSHIAKLGLMALIGTGIFAAIDCSYAPTEQLTGSHRATRAKNDLNVSRTPLFDRRPAAKPKHPSSPESDSLAEANREPSAIPAPASAAPPRAIAIDRSGVESSGTSVLVFQASTDSPDDPVTPSSRSLASRELALQEQTTLGAPVGTASLNRNNESGSSEAGHGAAAHCQLSELRSILDAVSARFGGVTVVAAHQFKTANHIAGSTREKMHQDCKAIDFRPDPSRIDEIKVYLRSRPEISGVESYRDGVIHIDAATILVAGGPPQRLAGRAQTPGRRRVALQGPQTLPE